MQADRALLAMENARVVRDVRGRINRRVNIETANIGKTVDAAARQIIAIERLLKKSRPGALPPALREMAALRIENPEATLEELGAMFDPPLGKSGVNHRLRRLMKIAEEDEEEENAESV
jgi:DNA-binding protein WhiA